MHTLPTARSEEIGSEIRDQTRDKGPEIRESLLGGTPHCCPLGSIESVCIGAFWVSSWTGPALW